MLGASASAGNDAVETFSVPALKPKGAQTRPKTLLIVLGGTTDPAVASAGRAAPAELPSLRRGVDRTAVWRCFFGLCASALESCRTDRAPCLDVRFSSAWTRRRMVSLHTLSLDLPRMRPDLLRPLAVVLCACPHTIRQKAAHHGGHIKRHRARFATRRLGPS